MKNQLLIKNCRLYQSPEDKFVDVYIENSTITKIQKLNDLPENLHILDAKGRIIVPGFIDVHIQGAGGSDILDGTAEAIQTISRTLARFGTTSFLGTTVVHSDKENHHIELAAENTGKILEGAHLLGLHLEGPFINPEKRGGISPKSIYNPSTKALEDVLKLTGDSLKMMTIAPEINGNLEIIRRLADYGIIASFGHSGASYGETRIGFKAGISHVTHLFNAMPSLHHREPGPLLAIFESENVTTQVISDGVHLHRGIIKLIHQLLGNDRIVCITDGVQAIGLPEGEYIYNDREYRSKNGTARYLDGTLIGTAISLDQIWVKFMNFTGCSLKTAVHTVTRNPARLLRIEDRKGSIEVGKDADLVILNPDYSVWATIIGGGIVYRNSD